MTRCIAQDKDGNMWISSLTDGLSIITTQGELIMKIDNLSGINHIYCDSHGDIWISTIKGICVFPKGKNFDYFTLNESDGISDDYVHATIEGNEGEMWFSTNTAISLYSLTSKKFENYNNLNEVPLGSFISGCVSKSDDGIIFFGSQNGVCYFDSKESTIRYTTPKVMITNIKLYNTNKTQTDYLTQIPLSPNIRLDYNQNTFTIDFNVMDYAMMDLVEYSYSMEGLDTLWYIRMGKLKSHLIIFLMEIIYLK